MTHDPLALECLAAILEEGGFDRAAKRLHITQSAVSQRLRALESQVGTVLVVRSRPLAPTPAGAVLMRHAKQLRLLRTDLGQDLRELAGDAGEGASAGPQERISIAVNADSIATWVLPALAALMGHGGLPVEIITDDQDFTHDWLRSGQVMGCVTTVSEPLRGCRVTSLGAMQYLCVANPTYVREHLVGGLSPANFRSTPFVAFNRKDDLQADFVGQALGLVDVRLQQRYVPSSEGQVRAVLQGWGASVLPHLLVAGPLERGELVDVCPNHRVDVRLFWHCWNIESRVLDGLTTALVTGLASHLSPIATAAPQLPIGGLAPA